MTPQEIMEWATAIGYAAMSAFVCIFAGCYGFELMRDTWRKK